MIKYLKTKCKDKKNFGYKVEITALLNNVCTSCLQWGGRGDRYLSHLDADLSPRPMLFFGGAEVRGHPRTPENKRTSYLEKLTLFRNTEKRHPAEEVTTHEVTQHLTDIDDEDLRLQQLLRGRDEEIESIGNAMGEATEDEDGHTQQQGEHLTLTGELYCRGHDKATTDGQEETSPRTFSQTTSEDLRSGLDTIGLGIGYHPGREQTTYDISQQHHTEHRPVTLSAYKACCPRVKFHTIIDHGSQSKSKENGTSHTPYPEVYHTSDRDTDTCQDGQGESLTKQCCLHSIQFFNIGCKGTTYSAYFFLSLQRKEPIRLKKMKTTLRMLLLTTVLLLTQTLTAQEWKLVWSDEFNKDGRPDEATWNYERGFVRNHEDQWYQPENAWQEDGLLIIEARRESKPNPTYRPHSRHWGHQRDSIRYSSACLTTMGKRQFLYGRLEVSARIPISGGSWPAIWTLGTGMPWPSCGEIDLMEYYRIGGVPHILANVAWGNDIPNNAVWNSRRVPYTHFTNKDPLWHQRFHVWRMDWDKTSIRLYLDDELLNEVPLSTTVNGAIGKHTNPFNGPQYILLNLALGGDNGGEIDDSAFPLRYEIDYVRIYSKE